MRPFAVIFAVSALSPVAAAAYPISPQTLWQLAADAQLIVLARVDRIDKEPADEDHPFSGELAVLEVLETWKGTAPARVSVSFSSNIICPAPARYDAGRRVIAFLSEDHGTWYTEGLSYGTRYPADAREELEYADAVKRAVEEQKALKAPSSNWALATARARATRWDGLYALRAGSDVSKRFYDRGAADTVLTAPTLAELERIMIDAPSFDRTLVQLLTLLRHRKSAAVTQAAADAMESVLSAASAPYWMDEAIDLLEERLGAGAGPAALPKNPIEAEMKLAGSNPWNESAETREERVQQRWHKLKQKRKLDAKLRPDFARERWTGTGGQTPM